MARTPQQTPDRVHVERKRLELMFSRAEANVRRPSEVTRRVLELLRELIAIYSQDAIAQVSIVDQRTAPADAPRRRIVGRR